MTLNYSNLQTFNQNGKRSLYYNQIAVLLKARPVFLFSILLFLVISIPNVYSQDFDEEYCLSLISADQVKKITGFEGTVNSRIINEDLATTNDDISSMCFIGFENEDSSFVLSLGVSVTSTEEIAKEKFEESLAMAATMDIPVDVISENGWEYYVIEIGQSGLDSFLVSKKNDIIIGINAPTAWYTIDSASLLEMARVVHANIDGQPYEIKQTEPKTINDSQNQADYEKSSSIDVLDGKTCLSLISADQAEDLIGNKFTLKTTGTTTPSHILGQIWGEGATGSCSVHIKNQDRSFEIIASVISYETNQIAQSHYENTLSQRQHGSYELHEGKSGEWDYHLVEINLSGIGSGYNSVKDNLQLILNIQPAEPPIDTQTSIGFASIIQTSLDEIESQDPNESNGGGCLIATATYGTELAPQVQQLRELRDNSLLQTKSGTNFMNIFNDVYYSFSPYIADYERQNPVFKELVKVSITPMISSFSILNHVEMNSEESVLGYGVSLIILNLVMYVGVPAFAIIGIKKKF